MAFVSGGASGLGAAFVRTAWLAASSSVVHLLGQGALVAFVDVDAERGEALRRAISPATFPPVKGRLYPCPMCSSSWCAQEQGTGYLVHAL